MASSAILSNFFEEQWTFKKPPTIPLSRALFPTTFLEIAVYWSPIDLGNYCFAFRLEKEKFQLNRSFYILFIFFFL